MATPTTVPTATTVGCELHLGPWCTGDDDTGVFTRAGFMSACDSCAKTLDAMAAAVAPKRGFRLEEAPF